MWQWKCKWIQIFVYLNRWSLQLCKEWRGTIHKFRKETDKFYCPFLFKSIFKTNQNWSFFSIWLNILFNRRIWLAELFLIALRRWKYSLLLPVIPLPPPSFHRQSNYCWTFLLLESVNMLAIIRYDFVSASDLEASASCLTLQISAVQLQLSICLKYLTDYFRLI